MSTFNQKYTPFLYEWDQKIQNIFHITNEIDLLEKQQDSLFTFDQRRQLRIQLLKKFSMIGEIYPEEFQLYQHINKNVESDFQKTFSYHRSVPIFGLGIGILMGLSIKSYYKQSTVFMVIKFFIEGLDIIYKLSNQTYNIKTLEFLSFVLEHRKSKADLELHGQKFYEKHNQKLHHFKYITKTARPLMDIYEQYVNLVTNQ